MGNSITGQLEVDAFSIPTLILSVDVAGGILCCKGRVWKYYCTTVFQHGATFTFGQYENAAFNNTLSVGRLRIVENIMMLH